MTLDPSIEIASVVFGTLIFATAVVGKLRHRDEFSGIVASYRLLPQMLSAAVASGIIALELFVAISFVSGLLLQGGVIVALSLLLLFAVAMGINIARGRTHIDCGCFQSALRQPLSIVLIVRNILLMFALAPILIGALSYSPSLPERLLSSPSFLAATAGLAAGIALFLIYQAFELIITLRDVAAAFNKRFV